MRRFAEVLVFAAACIGWTTALREREKAERLAATARGAAAIIRRDVQGTTLVRPGAAERWSA